MTEPTVDQIRSLLGEAMSDVPEPLAWSDIESRSVAGEPSDATARRRGVWLATAAAVAALVVGFIVLVDADGDDTVRIDTPDTTITETTTSTIPAPAPSVVETEAVEPPSTTEQRPQDEGESPDADSESGAPAAGPARLTVPESGGTQPTVIGDITWTVIEGDASTQPSGVSTSIDGVFFGVENDGQTVWRSDDGIAWELHDRPPNGILGVFEIDGETYARRSTLEGQGLGRWDGEVFAPIELPASLAPEVAGLAPTPEFGGDPVEFGGRWLIPVTTRLTIPWNALFGVSVYPEWDQVTETMRIFEASDGPATSPIAVLTTEVVDADPAIVEFRDSESGELVTSVEQFPGLERDEWFDRLVRSGGFAYNEFLIGGRGGFDSLTSPWPLADDVRFASLDGRLLGLAQFYESGSSRTEFAMSDDTVTWRPGELPVPTRSGIDFTQVVSDGSLALLTIVSSDEITQVAETWSTVDGVNWEPADDDPGFGGTSHTDVGWFRAGIFETGGIEVSADGLVWQEIDFGIRSPDGPGGGGASVFDDTIFVSSFVDGGARTLWVGQLNDE